MLLSLKLKSLNTSITKNNNFARQLQYNVKKQSHKHFTNVISNLNSVPDYSFTQDLDFHKETKIQPIFRALNGKGEPLDKKFEILDKETSLKILNNMIKINAFDDYFNSAQRLNVISFYMTCKGEEAAVVSSCAALKDEDSIYPQYREAAALLYRGFSSKDMTNQLTGNHLDLGKGRQMPIHYGSKKLNYQTVSSPLATQIPQASGAGYLFRVKKEDKVCLTYFGEGAASEGDFHAALNFAATLRSQTIFFCRNNKYAISTSFQDQYRGDGIASRGPGYGIKALRIDGNDALGVYYATKEARKYVMEEKKPILIEAMSFRGGDHSTSDYSANYRTDEIMKGWEDYLNKLGNPIKRFEAYCLNKKWIEKDTVANLLKESKAEAKEALKYSTSLKKPSISSMFDDTWDFKPENLKDQEKELLEHIEKYGSNYALDGYHNSDKKE